MLLCSVFRLKSLTKLENRNISYKKNLELRVKICKYYGKLFRDGMKLNRTELHLEGFCSFLTGRFPKFVVSMIISDVVVEVFYYKPLSNLKEYKCFHGRFTTDTTFM